MPDGCLDRFHHVATEQWPPRNGARVVARAWVDLHYRARLLADGPAACAELGYRHPARKPAALRD